MRMIMHGEQMEGRPEGARLYKYITGVLGRKPQQEDIDGFTDWVECDSERLEASLMGDHVARCRLADQFWLRAMKEAA